MIEDPSWFAVDLHVPDRRFGFLRVPEAQIEREPFLDIRMSVPWAEATQVPVDTVPATPPPRVAWLFHTSFCASTLLARALHVAPHTVCLKEPFLLRRLADARKSGWPVDGLLERSVHLLGRPWHPGAAVVIKPTHVALNLAVDLMRATPDSRGVIMTSGLVDFMISNLKKLAESQAKIPELVKRALLASGLNVTAQPPDLICASALQWAAQRELMWQVIETLGDRVRPLDAEPFLADVVGGVRACASWLQLGIPDAALVAHATAAASRHAKAETASYSPAQRAHEATEVAAAFGPRLAFARDWLAEHVLPAMRPSARAGA